MSLLDQAVVSGTSFATTILVGRLAGHVELGVFALGITIVLLVATAQDSLVSVPYTFFRGGVGEERAREYRGSVLVHWAAIAALTAAGLAVLAAAFEAGAGPAWMATPMWVLAAVVPAVLLRDFARRYAFAHLRVGSALAIDGAVAFLQLGVVLALGLTGHLTGAAALAALGAANGIAAAAWLLLGRRDFRMGRAEATRTFGLHWRFARWDLSAQVVGIAASYAVYWLLALLRDPGETGLFAACMAIVAVSNPFILGVNNIFMPRVAEAAEAGPAEVSRVVRGTSLWLALVMAAVTVVLVLFGGALVELVYGADFGGQGTTMAIVAVAAAAGAMQITVANGLRALRRPDVYFGAGVAALAVIVVIGWPLIAAFGVRGAAWALLAGALIEPTIQWVRFGRLVRAPFEAAGKA